MLSWHHFAREGRCVKSDTDDDTIGAHFLHLLHGHPSSDEWVRAMHVSLILYAEQEFNAFTFTARVIAAPAPTCIPAISGAIGALKGPKHGGTNEAALEIQQRYASVAEAEADIRSRVAAKEVIIGFGHPVYTISDPRNVVIEKIAHELSVTANDLLVHPLTLPFEATNAKHANPKVCASATNNNTRERLAGIYNTAVSVLVLVSIKWTRQECCSARFAGWKQSQEELMKDLDPQSQAIVDFLNKTGVLPFSQWEPEEARTRLLALRVERPSEHAHEMYKVSEETIHTADGSFVVRILEPRAKGENERMPVVLYFHGGGFFAGGLNETDLIVRQIAKQSDVVVINIDYHHSPEFRFPVAVNDAYAALCWTVEHAERLGIDPANIVLAGDSAGGNLTIVTCIQARERGGPPIKFQVPIYPSLDLSEEANYPSRQEWGGGNYFLIGSDIDWMLKHYFTNRSEGRDWRASPMFAKSFASLPPALVVTASHDPLVDEGKIYADRLAKAGVPVEYKCFEGTFHGFVSFAIVLDAGKRGMNLICDRIKESVSKQTAGIAN